MGDARIDLAELLLVVGAARDGVLLPLIPARARVDGRALGERMPVAAADAPVAEVEVACVRHVVGMVAPGIAHGGVDEAAEGRRHATRLHGPAVEATGGVVGDGAEVVAALHPLGRAEKLRHAEVVVGGEAHGELVVKSALDVVGRGGVADVLDGERGLEGARLPAKARTHVTCKSSKDHSKPRNEVDTSLKSPV